MFFMALVQDLIDLLPELFDFAIGLGLESVPFGLPLSRRKLLYFDGLPLFFENPIALFCFCLGFLPKSHVAQGSLRRTLLGFDGPHLDGTQPLLKGGSLL